MSPSSGAALVYDRLTADEAEILLAGKRQGLELLQVFLKDPSPASLSAGETGLFQVAVNRCESKTRALRAAWMLEKQLGKRVVNPYRVEALCASKTETLNLWAKQGLAVPECVFIPFVDQTGEASPARTDWQERAVVKIEASLSYPLVVKPTQGSWGRGVILVRDHAELVKAVGEAQPSLINPTGLLAQEFVDKPGFDLRILCWKKPAEPPRYLCCIARVSRSAAEFRTNTHLGGLPVGVNLKEFPKAAADACRAAASLQEEGDASIVALDAMPLLNDRQVMVTIQQLAKDTAELFDEVRQFVAENETKRYRIWREGLEARFQAYKVSPGYQALSEKIRETLDRARIIWHEANSRFDFAVNTRNASGVNPAEAYIEICKTLTNT
ncbi:MAG: hypothetical protein QW057_05520 [Candidatus Bathyarchaeia archaeon]